ncbi:hypothetical protein [uncultured Pseudomonas sp.]|uniref:hypothetical protein n=1 Tax=uncultured Pseudomonas sp. TaxID=114707 RepID=UPI002613A409|nr:hypothetical protein [uncultured Pseudomonas sp.]
MLIGFSPLGSAPLGSAGASAAPVPEPVYVVRGISFVWRVRLLVGGVDLTQLLTGLIDIDREEGAAGVAGFSLLLPPGPVVPPDWTGKPVELDYISRNREGVVTTARLYTGTLEMPAWDSTTRILSCECSDQRQDRVEALTIEQITALIPGTWSADAFEPIEGRSRWEYAEELLSTITASLDCSATGELRTTSWYATAPAFVFGPGTTLYKSVQIDLQPQGASTNTVEIEASYRYSRLYQNNTTFGWGVASGIGSFCTWRQNSHELPTTDMIESAVTGAGLSLVGGVGGYKLPGNMADPCGDGNPWINPYDNLWLSATAKGAARWVQTITQHYTLTLTAGGSATPVMVRESSSFEVEDGRVDDWESGKPTSTGIRQDLGDESRRVSFLSCLLNRGKATLVDAHRGTTISWQTPTDMALAVDLRHTLRLDDTAKATGKCRRIQHNIDLGSGRAITTLSVAVMRGGGVNDPLVVPAAPDTSLPDIPSQGGGLVTQLGGRLVDPVTGYPISPYDEARLGFSGNWDAKDDLTAEDFPRRFAVSSVEIDAVYRDELQRAVSATYRVAIPNDQLEL